MNQGNELDFKDLDKTNFKTFQMPDGSVYFGEIAFVTPEGELIEDINAVKEKYEADKAALAEAEPPAEGEEPEELICPYKMARHGYGVNFYGKTEGRDILCKFEGQWEKNLKHGRGFMAYPDGSEYKGQFKKDQMEGYGKFVWAQKGHIYEGNWMNSRMEGGGEFTHASGNTLQGNFKNNYFNDRNKRFLNPFQSLEELQDFVQKSEKFNSQSEHEKKQHENRVRVHRVGSIETLKIAISETKELNRVPLFVTSVESGLDKAVVWEKLQATLEREISEIDFRAAAIDFATMENRASVKEGMHTQVGEALVQRKILMFNVDDTEAQYKELYDPNILEFYGSKALPEQVWTPEEMSSQEIQEACGYFEKKDIEEEFEYSIEDYHFMVWTKFKLEGDEADDLVLVQKLEDRFSAGGGESSLINTSTSLNVPLKRVNLVFITGLEEPAPPQEEHEGEGEQEEEN